MRRSLFSFLTVSLVGCTHSASTPSVLPLRSVRLYDTGVAYFERSGTLGADDSNSLPVPAGHLDDALKTLVVLTPNGQGTVGAITFGTTVPSGLARSLAGLPSDTNVPLRYRDLLAGLKGATVDVRTAEGTVRGQLLNVLSDDEEVAVRSAATNDDEDDSEKKKAGTGRPPPGRERVALLLLTAAAEVRRIPIANVQTVQPAEASVAARLRTSLAALAPQDASSPHRLRLTRSSTGPVTFGYVTEAPIYRMTYRLVLNANHRSGVLQGWALVHNDTGEDWRQVRVQLVNGKPDSFLSPLGAPRYARRELVAPDQELSTVPQLLHTNADAMWGDFADDGNDGKATVGVTGHGASSGGGAGLGSISTTGHGGGVGVGKAAEPTSSSLLQVGNLAHVASADGIEGASLFAYTLRERLTLEGHHSALVPFLAQSFEAEDVTWVDPQDHARHAVRLRNVTWKTLPAGPLAVFADGGFAGETSLDRLKPGEHRFLTYGDDLDAMVRRQPIRYVETPRRVVWENGILVEHYLRDRDFGYALENRSGQPRRLYFPLDMNANAVVRGADRSDYDPATGKTVVVFDLPPRHQRTVMLHGTEGLVRPTLFEMLTTSRLTELAAVTSLPPSDRAILTIAASHLQANEEAKKLGKNIEEKVTNVEKDIARFRKNLEAAEEKGAVGGPFGRQLLAAEAKLEGLRVKLETAKNTGTAKAAAARGELERLKASTPPPR